MLLSQSNILIKGLLLLSELLLYQLLHSLTKALDDFINGFWNVLSLMVDKLFSAPIMIIGIIGASLILGIVMLGAAIIAFVILYQADKIITHIVCAISPNEN